MANRLFNPDIQFADSTGAPYSGGQLFFYASGTSTKQNTYSDSGLTTPNANPVVLDSAGRAGPIFLQNLQYKVVLAPSTDTDPPASPIWTQDPVYTSDYSAQAKFKSGSGSPNGVVAGTAGSATTSADSYWDYTNDILYICTTTGTASTAVWTAVNSSSAAAVVPFPQGYITPTSGTPIISGDVVSATTLYYTPYNGLLVPIYNGSSFVPTSIIAELQYTLTSNLTANNIYDLYVFSLAGVPTFGSGPTWAAGTGGNITAGSCARGTGAGGAAISRLQGIWTNTASMTMRYGDGTKTTTVNANQGTYVGSVYIDGTNGQVSCYRSYGQSRKWGIWNAYNRAPIILKAGDNTASWTENSVSFHPQNASTANSLTTFCGLAEEEVSSSLYNYIQLAGSTSTSLSTGIGWNSTTAASGFTATTAVFGVATDYRSIVSSYIAAPALGINTATSLAIKLGGASSDTYIGHEAGNVLTAHWRG